MNIDGPTAHAIQASGEDDGFFVTGSYGTLRTSITTTVRIEWIRMVTSTATFGMPGIPTGEALRAPLIQIIIFIFFEMALQIIMVEFLNMVPTGLVSPGTSNDCDDAYYIRTDGDFYINWGTAVSLRAFRTLRT